MKIISLNVNGVLNAIERGLIEWLENTDADVVCLQDLRVKEQDLPDEMLQIDDFNAFFYDSDQDDHAGVAIYCREMPKAIMHGMGFGPVDSVGRFLQADFEKVSVASVLVPNAYDLDDELETKLEFLQEFESHLKKTRRKRRDFVFTGTFFVAHKTIDLGNWEQHQREPGFLTEERALLDQITGPVGYVDSFRRINNQEREHTWWPYDEAQSNGSRIDYQFSTPNLGDYVCDTAIMREPRLSTHCAVMVEYDLDF